MKRRICILGGGAMGTACAVVLARNAEYDVRLWVRNPEYARTIAETRLNTRLLPGVSLPSAIRVSGDAATALADAELVVSCIPIKGIRSALETLRPLVPPAVTLVNTAKGIETDTLARPSQMMADVLPNNTVVTLG
ncbi:MAG: NAD(P)-binding domain-containing protein, partial [Planctomycetaceae bacterium]|nr:NAD(P)-binding domain-containing protein [Planctomycetaceae bacterium]